MAVIKSKKVTGKNPLAESGMGGYTNKAAYDVNYNPKTKVMQLETKPIGAYLGNVADSMGGKMKKMFRK